MQNRSFPMKTVLMVGIVLIILVYLFLPTGDLTGIKVSNPYNGAMFPPEIAAPTFRWSDQLSGAENWQITINFTDGGAPVHAMTDITEWRPDRETWETIKHRSVGTDAKITISGKRSSLVGSFLSRYKPVSRVELAITTSADSVGAPIMYRDVPLPFDFAREKMELIQWRLGDISSYERPPVILENLPVCGNCHSFTADGSLLGMDVDSGGDKGSYAVTPVEEEIFLTREKLITWSDYRREDGESTFGLLAELSPDGKYVASAVKDRVIFITREKLMFSQLFFPVKGIVAIYNRENGVISPLPGADDPDIVQANPVWSPDGKYIIYARTPVSDYVKNDYTKNSVLTRQQSAIVLGGEKYLEDSEGGETFCFNLYRIPFNDGKGGEPEPVPGASNNGKSNYFARYSPDGKWIVFCQARSFMLLQPDSKLYIMPADFSAPPRLMNCNTNMMNSRHSWSPNSRWMVFSSKANGAYTDLYLTHIDENGNDTPPVLIESFSSTDRARNIPVFAPMPQNAIAHINEAFVDYYSYVRKGDKMVSYGNYDEAIDSYRISIDMNPEFALAYRNLGTTLSRLGRVDDAIEEFKKAYELDPKDPVTCTNLGNIILSQGDVAGARAKFNEAIRNDEKYGSAYQGLGLADYREGNREEAIRFFKQGLEYNPELVEARYYLGLSDLEHGDMDAAEEQFRTILRIRSDADAFTRLGEIYIQRGMLDEAERNFRSALAVDESNMGALHNLGIVYMNRQQYDQAEQAFRTVYMSNPNNPNACFMLGAVLGRKADTVGDAISLYQKGLELMPDNPQGYVDLANLFMRIGRADLALPEFEKASSLRLNDQQLKAVIEQLRAQQ